MINAWCSAIATMAATALRCTLSALRGCRGSSAALAYDSASKPAIPVAACVQCLASGALLQGGVGRIAEELVAGLQERGGAIEYKANVREILTEGEGADMHATGVRLADGRVYR